MVKSPLRYPGGKTRAIPELLSHLPAGLTALTSPFIGGGSFELACASRGIKVSGYDSFAPLTNFWRCLLEDSQKLASIAVAQFYPMTKPQFYMWRDEPPLLYCDKAWHRAAVFYALNRCSFSGLTYAGGYSRDAANTRYTRRGLTALASFAAPNLSVATPQDFTDTITAHPDNFLYCDPPYYTDEKLYGRGKEPQKDFPHAELATLLLSRKGWLLSYNDCDYIREIYHDCVITEATWSQSHWGKGRDTGDVRRLELIIKPK